MVKRGKVGCMDILLVVFLTLLCGTMLYPFVNILFISVSDIKDVTMAGGLLLYPKSISFEAYQYIFQYKNLWRSFTNTVFIAVMGTAISLILSVLGGYVLSKRDLPGRKAMMVFVLIPMFFAPGLIPTYLQLKDLHLLNSLWVLILPCCISTWNLLLARNFFMGIPKELCESASIDGASELRMLFSVVLPLSLPIVATLGLFYGVGYWNEYSRAIIYNTNADYQTLQVIVSTICTTEFIQNMRKRA